MCRNHSHIACEITGTVLIGRNVMVEVRVDQPLGLELPFGAKWIRPSGVHLLMPYSMRAGLPLSTPVPMAVCYIPSFSWEESGTTMTPETAWRLRKYGDIGETAYSTTDTSLTPTEENDDAPL